MECEYGVKPNMHCYASMLMAFEKSGEADNALDLYQKMRANNVRCTNHAYRYGRHGPRNACL